MVQRKWSSIDPLFSATDPYMACNRPGSPAVSYIPVRAGENLTAVYWYWLHPVGPMSAWLAACGPGGCEDVDVARLDWFKIWEAGLEEGTLELGTWYQKSFQRWDGSPALWPVTIPATLRSGLYLIRHEILSLHIANRPQFYPECAHLNVSGSGTALPPTDFYKKFPGVYDSEGRAGISRLSACCEKPADSLRSFHQDRYLLGREQKCHSQSSRFDTTTVCGFADFVPRSIQYLEDPFGTGRSPAMCH
jgi:hypothetical protein